MFCSNCGAVVVGKFCSCCGKKALDPLTAFRRCERKTLRDFENEAGKNHRLANACWYACELKYGKDAVVCIGGHWHVMPDAYEKLEAVKNHAVALFNRLLATDDF